MTDRAGLRRGIEYRTPLTAVLGDEDAAVRAAAAWSLGEIGPAAAPAVPALRRLKERDPSCTVVVDEALARILGTRGQVLQGNEPQRARGVTASQGSDRRRE